MYRLVTVDGKPAFETLTDEGSKQGLLDSWSSVDQQLYNELHTTCPACQGQGYKVRREGKAIVRDKMGCYECLGTGAVLKETA